MRVGNLYFLLSPEFLLLPLYLQQSLFLLYTELFVPLPHLMVKVEPHQLQLLPLPAQLAGAQVHPAKAEVP